MDKKKLILLLGIVIAAALIVIGTVIILNLPGREDPPQPGETSTPYPEVTDELDARFGDFSYITVTVGGDPRTEINITWQSMSQGRAGYVKYAEKGGDIAKGTRIDADFEYETFSVPTNGQYDFKNPSLVTVGGLIHRCYLTGLKPGAEYVFKAYYEDGAESEEKSFKTVGDGDSFSFILIADTQGFTKRNFDVTAKLAELAVQKFPDYDFVVHMGDAVEEGKNHYQWMLYFESAEKLTAGKPVVDVAGNRDKKHTLAHYTNGSQDNRTALVSGYYSFDVGSVHFSVLNTGDGDKDLPKAQLKWLRNDLQNAAGKTKVILMHKAPYTNANHCLDEEILAIRSQIMPVASEYGVSAVISGHDHYLFRSAPVLNGEAADVKTETVSFMGESVKMMKTDGTVYFVNGSAGVKQHDDPIKEQKEVLADAAALLKGPSFSYVKVEDGKMYVLTYVNENGVLRIADAWGIYLQ